MQTVVFKTPGHIDIRAFTTFGINTKPNSENPIGFFGTGLKYAIAVLIREGAIVRLFIGGVEYEFYAKTDKFRDKSFSFVMMRKRKGAFTKWFSTELPYTTEHGKTWELWQAFRELESNTRDENGETYLGLNAEIFDSGWAHDSTTIVVESDKFAEVYRERDKIFLPVDKIQLRDKSSGLEVYNQPSNHLYYRGLRVYDLEKPSMYTYNFIRHMDLTEDRTLKYMFYARSYIGEHLARSSDEKLIHQIAGAEEKNFEHKLDFDMVYDSPSQEFMNVVKQRRRRNLPVSYGFGSYYDKYVTTPPPKKKDSLIDKWNYWLESGELAGYPDVLELIKQTIEALKEHGQVNSRSEPEEADRIPF